MAGPNRWWGVGPREAHRNRETFSISMGKPDGSVYLILESLRCGFHSVNAYLDNRSFELN